MFDHTVMVPPDKVLSVLCELDTFLADRGHYFEFYPIGSTADPREDSKDIDVMVDASEFILSNGCNNLSSAKDHFCLDLPGKTPVEKRGVSIHFVLFVPGVGHVQVDLMIADPADVIQFYHVHARPKGSPYKGKHRHMLMSLLARKKGLLWSPYRGLFTRNVRGKRGDFLTYDPDEVARQLLDNRVDHSAIASADSILCSVDDPNRLLQDLANDPKWKF